MSDVKPDFRAGGDAVVEANKSSGGSYARTHYLSIKDKESVVVRFLNDAYLDSDLPHVEPWLTVDQHSYIRTKGAPSNHKGNWPTHMGAVCRRDRAFAGHYADCYICDHIATKDSGKASPRTWALACIREQVIGNGSEEHGGEKLKGKVIGYRDATREVELGEFTKDDGTVLPARTITEKAIVVVNMGIRNFFGVLQGLANVYGTVLDRDFYITRTGAGTDTTYAIVPLDPITMGDGRVFDLRDPEFMARYEHDIDLAGVMTGMSSDEFYARFFDPRFEVVDGEVVPAGNSIPAKPSNEIDPDRLSELVNRVQGGANAPVAAGPTRDFG